MAVNPIEIADQIKAGSSATSSRRSTFPRRTRHYGRSFTTRSGDRIASFVVHIFTASLLTSPTFPSINSSSKIFCRPRCVGCRCSTRPAGLYISIRPGPSNGCGPGETSSSRAAPAAEKPWRS